MLFLYAALIILVFFYPLFIRGIQPSGYVPVNPSLEHIASGNVPVYFHYMTSHDTLDWIPHSFSALCLLILILSLLTVKSQKDRLFYIVSAAFFFILSLGPYFFFCGRVVLLPFMFLCYAIPYFCRLWWPINGFCITICCTAVLLSGLIQALRSMTGPIKTGPIKTAPMAKAVIAVLLAAAYLVPYYHFLRIIRYNPSNHATTSPNQSLRSFRYLVTQTVYSASSKP